MAAKPSANSAQPRQDSSQSSDSKAENLKRLQGVYHRMVRVSNGFVVEQLTITEYGTKLERLGDWDMRNVIESKALNALVRNCK